MGGSVSIAALSPTAGRRSKRRGLAATLDLEIAEGVDPVKLVGDKFRLFEWSKPLPANDHFSKIMTEAGFHWDLSTLYSAGTITFEGTLAPSALLAAGSSKSLGLNDSFNGSALDSSQSPTSGDFVSRGEVAVPEPATILLASLGLGIAMVFRRSSICRRIGRIPRSKSQLYK